MPGGKPAGKTSRFPTAPDPEHTRGTATCPRNRGSGSPKGPIGGAPANGSQKSVELTAVSWRWPHVAEFQHPSDLLPNSAKPSSLDRHEPKLESTLSENRKGARRKRGSRR